MEVHPGAGGQSVASGVVSEPMEKRRSWCHPSAAIFASIVDRLALVGEGREEVVRLTLASPTSTLTTRFPTTLTAFSTSTSRFPNFPNPHLSLSQSFQTLSHLSISQPQPLVFPPLSPPPNPHRSSPMVVRVCLPASHPPFAG